MYMLWFFLRIRFSFDRLVRFVCLVLSVGLAGKGRVRRSAPTGETIAMNEWDEKREDDES